MQEKIQQWLAHPVAGKALVVGLGMAVIWVLIRLLQRKIFRKIDDYEHRRKAKKISNLAGAFLTLILLALIYRDKLGGITVALGVAGAGIAFALQEVIASFAGWLAIFLGGFYKAGDRVQLGGIKGDVMDIGILRTTLMEIGQWVDGDLYNGRIVLIANSFVFKEPVFNYSGDFPFLWDEIKIPIQYGSDYERTRQILLRIGREVAGDLTAPSREKWEALRGEFRLEEAQTDPMVSMSANDNWVEFVLRYVVGHRKRRATKTELFSRILREVELSRGKIKFASATFHLVEAPEIKVTLNSANRLKKK